MASLERVNPASAAMAGWRADRSWVHPAARTRDLQRPAKDLGTGRQCARHHVFLEGEKCVREECSMAHRGEVQRT